MRKLFYTIAALSVLLATSMAANAADVYARPAAPPPYAPPPYAPPLFTWTGFYVGSNIGGAWAHRDVTDSLFGINFNNGNNDGVFIGGAQLGYNWQINYVVLGFEWDFDGLANNNNSGIVSIPPRSPEAALSLRSAPSRSLPTINWSRPWLPPSAVRMATCSFYA